MAVSDLKKLRKMLSISQGDLAKEIGVSQGLISLLESGAHHNQEVYGVALNYLQRLSKTGTESSDSPAILKKIVKTKSSRSLNWSWASFSRTVASSDIFESIDIDSSNHALLIADIAGSSTRGLIAAAQIRFGFTALAATTTPSTNVPIKYLQALGVALKGTLQKKSVPPGLGVFCLDSRRAAVGCSLAGLPSAALYSKSSGTEMSRIESDPADIIWSDSRLPKMEYLYLKKGDTIVIYTDGFWQWLKESKNLSTSDVNNLISETASSFGGDSKTTLYSILRAGESNLSFDSRDDATICVIGNSSRRRKRI